ncbi:unnamed protein product [Rotaria sp. Silwood2]|nr:unnamed protein product [Rotaria sp. Silwood2]
MSNSLRRRSLSQTSSSSPRTLRRLRQSVRRVQFSNINDNNNNSNDSKKSFDSQQQRLTTTNKEVTEINIDPHDSEMTSSNMISSLSLSSQDTNNSTTSLINTNNKSPSISDFDEVNEDSMNVTRSTPDESATKKIKKQDILEIFEEWEDHTGYTCKLCQAVVPQPIYVDILVLYTKKPEYLYNSQRKKYQDKNTLISAELKQQLDEKLISAIIIDSRSFNDFARPGIKSFFATAVPNYKPLHRTTIRRRLHILYKQHRLALRNVLENIPHLALTTDLWKNSRNRYFICLTGHFYDKQTKLISITLGFRLIRGQHVRSITTDNAPNMINAVYDLDIGIHHSCTAHNLHLMVKSTVLPSKKDTKSSYLNPVQKVTTGDVDLPSESSTDEDTDNDDDYSTSEEQDQGSTSFEENNADGDENATSNIQISTDEDETSLSSEDEQNYEIPSIDAQTDPTLQKIRLLIKQVRRLVNLVRKSSNLHEYVQQQKKEKKLPGDGLILDCIIRWNSCYLMLNRFVDYQTVIESMTILHRNVIGNLSFSVVQHLKQMIFTEDDWDHLISVRNVLCKLYDACRWLSGKHYQTLSVVYVIKRGLSHVLTQSSSSPQAKIENIIKKYLLIVFKYHFDEKLSVEQKEAILIAAYLDPKVYRKMLDEDKYVAEQIIHEEAQYKCYNSAESS